MDYEPSEQVYALEKVFNLVVNKYTERLKIARESDVVDTVLGADTQMAKELSYIDRSKESKLANMLKLPEVEMGLDEWFLVAMWRSSQAVKPKRQIKRRQDAIVDLLRLRSSDDNIYDIEPSGMFEIEIKFLTTNLALLDRAEDTGIPSDYDIFFDSCLTTYRKNISDEVMDVVLQIGSRNIIKVLMEAMNDFAAYWESTSFKKERRRF